MALDEEPDPAQRSEPIPAADGRGWFRRALFASSAVYAEVLILALLVNLLALAVPMFAIVAFDQMVPYDAPHLAWPMVTGVAAVFGFLFALSWLRSRFVQTAGSAAAARIGDRLFTRLFAARQTRQGAPGDGLMHLENDLSAVRAFLAAGPVLALVDIPFAFIFVAAGYAIGGPVAYVPLIAVAAILAVGTIVQVPMRVTVVRARDAAHRRMRHAAEALGASESVRGLGIARVLQQDWEAGSDDAHRADRTAESLSAWMIDLSWAAGGATVVGTMGYGASRVGQGDLSAGGLVAVALLAGAAMAPLLRLGPVSLAYHRCRAALRALDAPMRAPVDRSDDADRSGQPRIAGAIAFRNVSFRYPGQESLALDDVNFRIEPGEKVGLIGRMGAGKSAAARLLVGLYAPEAGTVAVGGADLRRIDPALLRAGIGWVPQEVRLFRGSLRDNLRLGAPDSDDARLVRAARIAGVDEFADRHPAGYDLPVGAGGQALSVGERQAVAIARALLRDAPVLLFDEPAGALDNTSERRLRARLSHVIGDKTLLLITNRASMLSLVDRLIVLDGGRVVADGAKQEVLDGLQGGLIRALEDAE